MHHMIENAQALTHYNSQGYTQSDIHQFLNLKPTMVKASVQIEFKMKGI